MNETVSYKRVRRYNVPGHVHFLTFSCYQRLPLLSNEVWRGWLGESVVAACGQLNVAVWAYVFMPEHVHVLVRPRADVYDISKLLHQVKQLVKSPEQWRWSSFRWLEMGKRDGEPLRLDDWDSA